MLACLWIEADRGPVPMELSVLIEAMVDDVTLKATITELLARKGAGHELDSGPRIPAISEFLEGQLARLGREVADIRLRYPDGVALDEFFRWALARGSEAVAVG